MINILAMLTGVQAAAAVAPPRVAPGDFAGGRFEVSPESLHADLYRAALPDPVPNSYPSYVPAYAAVPRRGFGVVKQIDETPGGFYRGAGYEYHDRQRNVKIRLPG